MMRPRWLVALAFVGSCASPEPAEEGIALHTPVRVPARAGRAPSVAPPIESQTPIELSTLAPTPVTAPPTRPLDHMAILHHIPNSAPTRWWWPIGDEFVAADHEAPAVLGLDRPFARTVLPEALRDFIPLRDLGELVLMSNDSAFDRRYIAFDPAAAAIRWQLQLSSIGPSYVQTIARQTLLVGIYDESSFDQVIAFSLASGREVWRLRGDSQALFERVERLWTDGERAYAVGRNNLVAFDPATGAILWSSAMVELFCGATTGEGRVVIEDPDGHRILDAATGALLRQLAPGVRPRPSRRDDDDHPPRPCRWHLADDDGGVAAAVIRGGRLYVLDIPGPRSTTVLRAFDLADGTERWHRPGLGVSVLAADHDFVLAERTGEILVILDASTGETRAEISIGGRFIVKVAPGAGEAGPLIVTRPLAVYYADATGTWFLGRTAEPQVPESFSIRGRLVPDDGVARRRVAGVLVRIGERYTRTDARGRFEARGRALGAVNVVEGMNRRGLDAPGSRFWFADSAVILDGRQSYDVGDLVLQESRDE